MDLGKYYTDSLIKQLLLNRMVDKQSGGLRDGELVTHDTIQLNSGHIF